MQPDVVLRGTGERQSMRCIITRTETTLGYFRSNAALKT